MSPVSLLERLEAECAQGWPSAYWPQDDPRVRRQRFPERCRYGHDLAANVVWARHGRRVAWCCLACKRAAPLTERMIRQRLRAAA